VQIVPATRFIEILQITYLYRAYVPTEGVSSCTIVHTVNINYVQMCQCSTSGLNRLLLITMYLYLLRTYRMTH